MTEASKRPRTAWGDGRVAFRAHSAEILEKIALGWPRSRIWREYKDRLGGLSNSQFNRYVQLYVGDGGGQAKSAPHNLGASAQRPGDVLRTSPAASRPALGREAPGGGHGQRQFHYDTTLNKDELI
jgi:hypothetical protein